MYKWFVWSKKKCKYLPILGLLPFSRGECSAELEDDFGYIVGVCISIPMFNVHNVVK